MAPSRNNMEEEIPENVQPASPRSPRFFQRLLSFVPPNRRSSPRHRPLTAPNVQNAANVGRRPWRSPEQEPLLPRPHIPPLSDQPCPNDPEVLFCYPSIEEGRCNTIFCGLCTRSGLRSAASNDWLERQTASIRQCSQSRPCTPRRAGMSCAHLPMDRRDPRSPGSPLRNSRLATVLEGSEVVLSNTRPPRVRFNESQRPGRASGLNLPALNSLLSSNPTTSPRRPPTRRHPLPGDEQSTAFGRIRERMPNPLSRIRSPQPRLHHLFGQQDHPYVHRHEAEQLVAAAEDAGIGPSITTTTSARLAGPLPPGLEFAETVFYPSRRSRTPTPVSPTNPTRPQSPTGNAITRRPVHQSPPNIHSNSLQHAPRSTVLPASYQGPVRTTVETMQSTGGLVVARDGRLTSFNVEFEEGDLYLVRGRGAPQSNHGRPPTRRTGPQEDASSTSTQMSSDEELETPASDMVGGKRLEMRGGNGHHGLPRLRGGGPSWEMSKPALSTLAFDLYKVCLTCGGICKDVIPVDDDVPPPRPRAFTWQPSPTRVSFPNLRGGGHSSNPQLVPQLRGGGWTKRTRLSQKLQENDKLPSSLWFLAGGRGPPITAKQWNEQKPDKRMGGLLGMAIYGHTAGTPYKKTEDSEESTATPAAEAGVSRGHGNPSEDHAAAAGEATPSAPTASEPAQSNADAAAGGQAPAQAGEGSSGNAAGTAAQGGETAQPPQHNSPENNPQEPPAASPPEPPNLSSTPDSEDEPASAQGGDTTALTADPTSTSGDAAAPANPPPHDSSHVQAESSNAAPIDPASTPRNKATPTIPQTNPSNDQISNANAPPTSPATTPGAVSNPPIPPTNIPPSSNADATAPTSNISNAPTNNTPNADPPNPPADTTPPNNSSNTPTDSASNSPQGNDAGADVAVSPQNPAAQEQAVSGQNANRTEANKDSGGAAQQQQQRPSILRNDDRAPDGDGDRNRKRARKTVRFMPGADLNDLGLMD